MNVKAPTIQHSRPFYAWTILIISVLFNAYSFTLQSSPGIKDLIGGNEDKVIHYVYALSGFFYAFALFQIPIGLLIDRFGSRIFPTMGVLLCASGAIYFSQTTSPFQMAIARFIMGAGGAFSFLNALKLISSWFEPRRFAFLFGIFIALGTLGILFLNLFFSYLAEVFHWKKAMLFFGIGGLVLACIFFLVVRDAPYKKIINKKEFWNDVKHVFNNSQVWIIGITVGLVIGPLFSFEAIWSIPFLEAVYNVPHNLALIFNTLFVIGYSIGTVYFGRTSTSLRKRKIFIPWGIGFTLMMMIIILYPPYIGIQVTAMSFFMLGFAASNVNLGYVSVHEHNTPQVTATAVSIVNAFYAFFAAITQSLIAVFLQLGQRVKDAPEYSIHDYQITLIRLPIYILIALIFSFFIKETHARQITQYND
ncbi:MAG: MFS transporter [Simkaniaceae bacterium]|nr:MAG: MFS transporter [Simkaniaceae bacterium]